MIVRSVSRRCTVLKDENKNEDEEEGEGARGPLDDLPPGWVARPSRSRPERCRTKTYRQMK